MTEAAPDTPTMPPTYQSALQRRILPPGIDGRTAHARRLRDLVQDLARGLRDPSDPAARAIVLDAANLIIQNERLAHRTAAGEDLDPDAVVRTSNAMARALDRLKDHRP